MRGKARTWRIAPFGLALLAPLFLGFAPPSGFDERVLDAQNRERTPLGIEPLQWSDDLASEAQGWADYLASTGQFRHAERHLRKGQGENLWAGTRGAYSLDEMVDAWAREKRYMKPGPFPHDEASIAAVGHYTQIVWRDTNEVGCAMARGRVLDVLVCRYRNPGNVRGAIPY